MTRQDFVALEIDADSLRKRFEAEVLSEKEEALKKRWATRAQRGQQWNLRNYKLFLAIDRAWESGFSQATQSLIGMLRDMSDARHTEDALDAAKRWGMSHLIVDVTDPKTNKSVKGLSIPAMYHITLSLARNATMQRSARLAADRLQVPTFKFEPAYQTMDNRLRAEVVTQRVGQMDREFGYAHHMVQGIQQSCMYGHAISFPVEEWYETKGYHNGQLVASKAGVRFVLPHPSRSYFDLDHPLSTLNTDTGCRYVGYWRVITFGSLRQQAYWNRERVKYSKRATDPEWALFFNTTGQCRMASQFQDGNWFSDNDREKLSDAPYFTASDDDRPVFITEHFEKINLKSELDDRLPDIDVWFRIVLGSDDTPLYMAPLPTRMTSAFIYEPLDTRALMNGMMVEGLAFDHHATNIFSQSILTLRQNLANVTMFDEDVIDSAQVRKDIENPNESFFRKLNFWGFSGRKLSKQQANLDQAFRPYSFPKQSIMEHVLVLEKLLMLMERVLGISAQETGSYASHEQSAAEVRAIQVWSNQRITLQGFYVDCTCEAFKSSVYGALMAYGTSDNYAMIDASYTEEFLGKLGFTVVGQTGDGRVQISAPSDKLYVEHWAERRDGPNRIPWEQIGNQMTQMISSVLGNPNLASAVPPEQLIQLLNYALEAGGFPKDFRLDPKAGAAALAQGEEELKKWVLEMLQHFSVQIKDYVARQMGQASPQAIPQPEPGMAVAQAVPTTGE